MQSPQGKAKILAGIHNKLKPGGKFLSHELLARDKEEIIRTELAQVIKVNSTPLSEANWIVACETADLQVQEHKTGSMALLNVGRMIQDEGIVDAIRILGNVLTHKPIRTRVLEMRSVFQKYCNELGYIILCAVA